MKKTLSTIILSLAIAGTANAQWHHHGGYRGGYYGGGNWVAPLILGGVIGYEINRANQPVIVQQPPVYVVTQPPVGPVTFTGPRLGPVETAGQQVITQSPNIQCPPGLAQFWTPVQDNTGRQYLQFTGCR